MLRAAILLFGVAMVGCFSSNTCAEGRPCEPVGIDVCEGTCVPWVGGGWEPVLVASSRPPRPRCPEVAPFEAMSSTSTTACGLQEAPGECSQEGFVCLPSAPPWLVCIVRDGAHDCPGTYPDALEVIDGITLCCPREDPPA